MTQFPISRKLCALALVAKAPVAGEVKTRLVPPLTSTEAAALNVCFLRDMATNIGAIAAQENVEGILVYTPVGSESAFEGILPHEFKLLGQRGESFGARLYNAADDLLKQGYSSVCLINSDSPTLPRSQLNRAVESLSQPLDRLVLGGANDGGYYLIGLKHAHESLFEGIPWSTADVLAQTVRRAEKIGLPIEMLQRWYDVDDAETLDQLCVELFTLQPHDGAYPADHTRAFLAALIKQEGCQRICPSLTTRKRQ